MPVQPKICHAATKVFFATLMLAVVFSGCKTKELAQCHADMAQQINLNRAEHLNADALETLYRLNNPTESFRLAAQSWQLQPNRNAYETLLKAYYNDVFEIDRNYYATPFYQTAYTFKNTIYNATFSPDGQYLIADAGNNAQLINVATGAVTELNAHNHPIYSVGFTPNGIYAFTTSEDYTAILWDSAGKLLLHLKGHNAPVFDLNVSPDGNTIATAGWDGTIRLWDWQGNNTQVITPGNNMELLTFVRISPDGRYLLTSDGFKLAFFDLKNPVKLLFTVVQTTDTYTDAAFSPTGATFAVSTAYGVTDLYDMQGKYLKTLYGHGAPIRHLAFSPDGKYFVTAAADKTAIIWDAASGTLKTVLRGHKAPLYHARFSYDGEYVLTTSEDGTARLWNWKSGKINRLADNAVSQTVFSPDEQHIITTDTTHLTKVWNWNGNLVNTLKTPANAVAYAYYPPAQLFTATQNNYETLVWNDQNKQVLSLQGNSAKGYNVWFSPKQTHIFTADQYGNAQIWDWNGNRLAAFSAHTDWLTNAAFSHNNKYIATASFDHTAKLWNLAGENLATLAGHAKTLTAVRFSKDGRQLVTTSKDGKALLWSMDSNANPTIDLVIAPYAGELNDADFAPDGDYVAIAAENGSASVWNGKGQPVITIFAAPGRPLQQVRFNHTGEWLATVAGNESPMLWPTGADVLLKNAADRGVKNLSPEELQWYEADEE